MIHAVIDTNVIVAALLTHNIESATIKVLNAIEKGQLVPIYNDEIIDEYFDVLSRTKFHFTKENIKRHISIFYDKGVRAERVCTKETFHDPKDVVFYEVALSKEDAYLITGNIKHFPQKPIVVSSAEMIEILARTVQD
ncbi:MAG: putative toxin-antitoxin system toxin component, PIN family [Marinilabiliaceae bacterium]|nr:putative toxin-antitoxin system toxin component, PIN family [Marinilabiliaceae bacterium]